MKKFIKKKFLMMVAICILLASSIFCSGRNTLSAYAYTDEEIAAAKEWLAANGYSPSRAGAEQAYQDYLNGKFGPVQGTETPPADNPPADDNASQEAGTGNTNPQAPEASAEQPDNNVETDTEQPEADAAAEAEQQTDPETKPKSAKDTTASAETKKESSATDADIKKKDTDTKKEETPSAVTTKSGNSSTTKAQDQTGTQNSSDAQNKDTKMGKDLVADGTDAIAASSATETAVAGATIAAVPDENTGNSYTIAICAVLFAAIIIVGLIMFLRKRNERAAS